MHQPQRLDWSEFHSRKDCAAVAAAFVVVSLSSQLLRSCWLAVIVIVVHAGAVVGMLLRTSGLLPQLFRINPSHVDGFRKLGYLIGVRIIRESYYLGGGGGLFSTTPMSESMNWDQVSSQQAPPAVHPGVESLRLRTV